MEEKYNWNLKDIYQNEDDFNIDGTKIEENLKSLRKYKGKLGESASNLYECYNLYEKTLEIYEKVYSYGMLNYHLDMSDPHKTKLYKKVENIGTEFEKATAFITPEIMRIENEVLLSFLNIEPRLQRYKRELDEIMRNKEHILSDKEEELLANYSEVFSSMENTFDILTNTEFKFGNLVNSEGKEVELTDANYTYYLKDKNEEVRKQAFNLMYKKYSEFLNTIGELYIDRVKEDTITARLRKYPSSLAKAVDNDDATIKVYRRLHAGSNISIDDHHVTIQDLHERIEIEKSEEGVKLVKIGG